MVKTLLQNWKTTSTGILMAAGAIVHLVFSIKKGAADENTWTITFAAILGGLGLVFAGDATQSAPVVPTVEPTSAATPKP